MICQTRNLQLVFYESEPEESLSHFSPLLFPHYSDLLDLLNMKKMNVSSQFLSTSSSHPLKYSFFFLSFTIITQDCSCESVCALFLQNEENDKAIKQILAVVSEKRKGRRGERGGWGRKNK